MSEHRELVIASARVAGPATVIGFLLALYLYATGQVGILGGVGVVLSTAAVGFALGLLVAYGTASASDRLVKTITAAGNLPPAASFSYEESLVIRGKPREALEGYEQHLASHPADVNARLALARLWRDELGEPGKAEQLYLEARRFQPSADQEFAIANALIDLYRGQGARGREMAELARFAQRFAGSDAGDRARAALQRMKSEEP